MGKVSDFVNRMFSRGKSSAGTREKDIVAELQNRAAKETAARELALNAAVGLIASTVSKCEFQTYMKGKAVKGDEYYLWNVQPNPNENAPGFIGNIIYRLCMDNEALVIVENGAALVADSFEIKKEYALHPDVYTGITAGGLEFKKDYYADEVMHFRLGNDDARRLVDLFYSGFENLIGMSYKAFTRSRGERGVLKTQMLPAEGTAEYYETLSKIQEYQLKPYFRNDSAAMPLTEGQEYTKTSKEESGATNADDSKKLIDYVYDVTARAFRIPPSLLRGEMADTSKQLTNYLTFCIDPVCRMMSAEITAKRYGKRGFSENSFLRIDTSSVKHFDMLDSAHAVDKLICSGTFSINELREAMGKPRIDESWACGHFMTKNYMRIMEGGEEDGE